MATIGVRELKRDASRVLRRVRERGEEIEITHHGGVVARLAPAAPPRPRRPPSAAWSTLDRVARGVVLRLPSLRLLTIGEELARAAAGLAARLRIRGADAVYIAAAAQLHLPLVTWDVEQRERAARVVEVLVPA